MTITACRGKTSPGTKARETWAGPDFGKGSSGWRPAPLASGRGEHANFDIDAGRQAQPLVEGLDGLAGRLQNIDQAFVGPDLELLARFSVNVRTAQHRVSFNARRQWNGPVHDRPGPLGGIDDFVSRAVQDLVVVGF